MRFRRSRMLVEYGWAGLDWLVDGFSIVTGC